MLVSDIAEIRWNSKNKKRFTELGYSFTHMGDVFEVKISDLLPYSNATVHYVCDYCGKVCTNIWQVYNRMHKNISKDCCQDCQQIKASEAIEQKYGSHSDLFKSSNKKRLKTNEFRYGCSNPFANEEIKQKIAQTNIEKYGVRYTQQNEAVRAKTVQTCRERYGVDHYIERFKGSFIKENSPVWKGGVEYSRVERASYEYIQWRKSVFVRDGYTCQKCGAHTGHGNGKVELNAHHIFNWKDNPDLRYAVENGITLCHLCHNEFHSNYGKDHNTREQLEEFLTEEDEKIC